MSQLRVAVIGAGLISREQHLPAWGEVPEAQVVGLADVDEQALETVGAYFDIPHRATDYRRLLDECRPDVVGICLPSALHAQVSIAALQAGAHVFCEKPMATCRADAVAMLETSRRAGRKLMIGQHLRYDRAARGLRQGLASIGLGHVYYARAQWLRRRRLPARPAFTDKRLSGGGALYDIGVHMLDLAWWIMGCPPPLSASGAATAHLAHRQGQAGEWGHWDHERIDVEDFAAGLVRFAGGGLLTLESSWLGYQPEPEMWRVQWFGTRAGALWPDARVFGETDGKPWDAQLAPAPGPKPHRAVVHAFARAVLDDAPVPIPPEQSATTIAVLDSLYRSSETGKEEPVEAVA